MKKLFIVLITLVSLLNANASDFFGLNWGDEAFYSINKLRLNYGAFSSYSAEDNKIYYFENNKMNVGEVNLNMVCFQFTPFFGKYYLNNFSALSKPRNNLLDALNDAEKIYKAMQYSHKLKVVDFVLENLIEEGVARVYMGQINRDNGISVNFSIFITHDNENGLDEYKVYCYGGTDDLTEFLSKK